MDTRAQSQIQTRNVRSNSSTGTHGLQRACACGNHSHGEGECAECKKKREATLPRSPAPSGRGAKGEGDVPPSVYEVLRSPGQPLDAQTRAFMEPRFGNDFSQVRVHTDTAAAESADAVNALAYTVGNHIVFGTNQYTAETNPGRQLLAHELGHVIQQQRAPRERFDGLVINRPHDMFEQEAERAAGQIDAGAQSEARFLALSGAPVLQRQQAKQEVELPLGGGSIAKYDVDKQGKIRGWNMDQIAKKVFQALTASKNAYIRVNGYYPRGDTEFDPEQPQETAKAALVQWIGKSKIPDIENRIVTYYGSGGPFAQGVGGEVEIEVAYSSLGPNAIPPGPSPQVAPKQEPKKEGEEAESPLETKVNLIPVEVSVPYDGGKKEFKQKITLEITYQLPPIKQFPGRKVEVSLGQFEVGFEGGVGSGGNIGEAPKKVWVAELGVSVTVIEVKVKEQLAGIIPRGLKVGLGMGFTGNIAEEKPEVKGEFKIESKNYFLKVEGSQDSLQFSVGVQFDVADLFKKTK